MVDGLRIGGHADTYLGIVNIIIHGKISLFRVNLLPETGF